jgi:hypothetical protein
MGQVDIKRMEGDMTNRKKTVVLAAAGSIIAAVGATHGGTFMSGFAIGLGLILCGGAVVTYRRCA